MPKAKKSSESEILCQTIVEGMQENKAKDIVILDLRHLTSAVCDFFVICSGDSNTHVMVFPMLLHVILAKYFKKNLGT